MASLAISRKLTPHEALEQAINAFNQRCRAMNLSAKTIDEFYRYEFVALRKYLEAESLDYSPSDFTPEAIRDFLAWRQTTRSSVCANHSYQTLSVFFKFLSEEHLITENPMLTIRKPQTRKTVMKTFSPAQMTALLETCEQSTFAGLRDRAIFLLLADTGVRCSELCSVNISDFNMSERVFIVTGKGNKERLIPYGQTAAQALQRYLLRRGEIDGQEAVFVTCYGQRLARRRILEIVKEHAGLANIPDDVATVHAFRRYAAIQFIREGGDVFTCQKLLGHSSLEMTRRYAQLAESDVIEKHRRFSPADALKIPQAKSGRKRLR